MKISIYRNLDCLHNYLIGTYNYYNVGYITNELFGFVKHLYMNKKKEEITNNFF